MVYVMGFAMIVAVLGWLSFELLRFLPRMPR